VKAIGYVPTNFDLEVAGGDRKALPTIKLKSLSERERIEEGEAAHKRKNDEERVAKENHHLMFEPWTAGASYVFSGPTFKGSPIEGVYTGLCLSAGKRLFGLIAVDLSLCTIEATSSDNNKGVRMSGNSTHFSASFFLVDHIFIKSSVGRNSHTYVQGNNNSPTTYQVSQSSLGTLLGYELNAGRWLFPMEIGAVRHGDSGAYQGSTSGVVSFGVLYAF
jgi:hypothetical protein